MQVLSVPVIFARVPLKLKNIDDSDNVIDEKDRTVIGNTNPKASGGFSPFRSRIWF